ncbi:MAG: rhodanese-like domain-containing protein [Flavobacteriaceae bacterium]|nr:rhodanese-like domain-containing protein [Flavobacteriaceae bacterium]
MKQERKSSSKSYRILAVIFILLAGGLVLLPKIKQFDGIKPEHYLANAISEERYISTDELADRIINQDPSILLIDVRDSISYYSYAIPNAINIPLEKIFTDDFSGYIDQDQYDLVFYSNDNFLADQVWLLCNRLGYKNQKVLRGGINTWFNTIINPKKPDEKMSQLDFELYDFRKAASMYFGVAYSQKVEEPRVDVKSTLKVKEPKVIIPKKKKKKMPVEGGC